jgi:dihydroneopterin aldolase
VSPTVVKLGGSYAHHPKLREIASVLGEGGGRLIVVPGGGPFADAVRREQKRIGYGDSAAHRMALLAMAAFGHALASLAPSLAPAGDAAAIRDVLAEGRVPVWLPLHLLAGDPAIPETWDCTSDSLAAWLCGRIGARRLILLKRGSLPSSGQAGELAKTGAIDPLVATFLARAPGLQTWIAAPRGSGALRRLLTEECPAQGRKIVSA